MLVDKGPMVAVLVVAVIAVHLAGFEDAVQGAQEGGLVVGEHVVHPQSLRFGGQFVQHTTVSPHGSPGRTRRGRWSTDAGTSSCADGFPCPRDCASCAARRRAAWPGRPRC